MSITQELDDFWAHDPFILPFPAERQYYLYTASRTEPVVLAYLYCPGTLVNREIGGTLPMAVWGLW